MRALLLAGVVVLGGAGVARADVFNFTYTLADGNVLGASLTGTLQGDGNTFNVDGYSEVTYNGAILDINPTAFQAYSDFNSNGYQGSVDKTGILTINGSYENFIDYNENTGYGFLLVVNAGYDFQGGQDITTVGFSNLGDQPFVATNFLATVSPTAVPEPASLALLGIGVVGIAALRRRRAI